MGAQLAPRFERDGLVGVEKRIAELVQEGDVAEVVGPDGFVEKVGVGSDPLVRVHAALSGVCFSEVEEHDEVGKATDERAVEQAKAVKDEESFGGGFARVAWRIILFAAEGQEEGDGMMERVPIDMRRVVPIARGLAALKRDERTPGGFLKVEIVDDQGLNRTAE